MCYSVFRNFLAVSKNSPTSDQSKKQSFNIHIVWNYLPIVEHLLHEVRKDLLFQFNKNQCRKLWQRSLQISPNPASVLSCNLTYLISPIHFNEIIHSKAFISFTTHRTDSSNSNKDLVRFVCAQVLQCSMQNKVCSHKMLYENTTSMFQKVKIRCFKLIQVFQLISVILLYCYRRVSSILFPQLHLHSIQKLYFY